MACGIPSTRRFGITLVNSDPGPSVIRSAWAIASSVSGERLRAPRMDLNLLDRCDRLRLMRVSPVDLAAVGQRRLQHHVGRGGGINAPEHRQHLGRKSYGLGEIAGQMRHGGQKQIAEAVSLQSAAARRNGIETACDSRASSSDERHHAVADIARRQHVEIAAQAAGTASVVGDGHHGGDLQDPFAGFA